ncbi:predicted protein [Phaeodactylum tricornutum CCAP 1055/1]|uniref:Uncharacterized protein n=1 Tax=Phaeodactylum tricornutum (strain CCAP 1055/1) TaxID=556484 RepID=B7GD67_PHATC|nr:predicted protein [Phaeodactylum tricornutum CCAP 1055/1]EEC43447.1 predicted protein [Phaeodactylum tricornutum CCAP 1055/1]|eukprot:XP_002185000.1 predicted protein [Phaeodactylum tricornutum CCAP 1055/1]
MKDSASSESSKATIGVTLSNAIPSDASSRARSILGSMKEHRETFSRVVHHGHSSHGDDFRMASAVSLSPSNPFSSKSEDTMLTIAQQLNDSLNDRRQRLSRVSGIDVGNKTTTVDSAAGENVRTAPTSPVSQRSGHTVATEESTVATGTSSPGQSSFDPSYATTQPPDSPTQQQQRLGIVQSREPVAIASTAQLPSNEEVENPDILENADVHEKHGGSDSKAACESVSTVDVSFGPETQFRHVRSSKSFGDSALESRNASVPRSIITTSSSFGHFSFSSSPYVTDKTTSKQETDLRFSPLPRLCHILPASIPPVPLEDPLWAAVDDCASPLLRGSNRTNDNLDNTAGQTGNIQGSYATLYPNQIEADACIDEIHSASQRLQYASDDDNHPAQGEAEYSQQSAARTLRRPHELEKNVCDSTSPDYRELLNISVVEEYADRRRLLKALRTDDRRLKQAPTELTDASNAEEATSNSDAHGIGGSSEEDDPFSSEDSSLDCTTDSDTSGWVSSSDSINSALSTRVGKRSVDFSSREGKCRAELKADCASANVSTSLLLSSSNDTAQKVPRSERLICQGGLFWIALRSDWDQSHPDRIQTLPKPSSADVLHLSSDLRCGTQGSMYDLCLKSGFNTNAKTWEPVDYGTQGSIYDLCLKSGFSTNAKATEPAEIREEQFNEARGGLWYLASRSPLSRDRRLEPYSVKGKPRTRPHGAIKIQSDYKTDRECGAKGTLHLCMTLQLQVN